MNKVPDMGRPGVSRGGYSSGSWIACSWRARQHSFRIAIRPVGLDHPQSHRGKDLFWIHSRVVSIWYFPPNIPALISHQNVAHVHRHAQSTALSPPKPYVQCSERHWPEHSQSSSHSLLWDSWSPSDQY